MFTLMSFYSSLQYNFANPLLKIPLHVTWIKFVAKFWGWKRFLKCRPWFDSCLSVCCNAEVDACLIELHKFSTFLTGLTGSIMTFSFTWTYGLPLLEEILFFFFSCFCSRKLLEILCNNYIPASQQYWKLQWLGNNMDVRFTEVWLETVLFEATIILNTLPLSVSWNFLIDDISLNSTGNCTLCRCGYGLRRFFGIRITTWMYTAVKGFWASGIPINFIYYRYCFRLLPLKFLVENFHLFVAHAVWEIKVVPWSSSSLFPLVLLWFMIEGIFSCPKSLLPKEQFSYLF